MSLMERFAATLNRHSPEAEEAQPAREALVDLLVWTMFVDHHIALAEHEKLDELTEDLPWRSIVGLRDFFSESVARARAIVEGDRSADAYLSGIAERLDEEAQRRAVIACEHMMGADGKMTREEIDHLMTIQKAFGLR